MLLVPAPVRGGDAPSNLADVIAPLLPAVVNVSVELIPEGPPAKPGEAGQGARYPMSVGSGFIIDAAGIIVTNKHVIDNAYEIRVLLNDNTPLPATVMGACACDIALLKVSPDKPLPTVKFGDSDELRIGDPVMAIGDPLGLGGSVSAGIVSALNRDIRTSSFEDFIQTDAAINHGNSGGPLFNVRGEVVGINTAIISPTTGSVGIGFAIPANDAAYVVDQIRHNGRVRIGWLGITVQQVTPAIALAVGMHDIGSSAIVTAVDESGPAAGKIRPGDVIRKFADKNFSASAPKNGAVADAVRKFASENFSDIQQFMRAVASTPIGQTTSMVILRDGVEQTIPLVVAEWPEDMKVAAAAPAGSTQPARADAPDLGLHLAALTDALRTAFNLAADQKGVLVTDITPGSAADDTNMRPGAVILQVQQDEVSSPAEVAERLSNARKQNRRYVLILILARVGPRWVPLALGPGAQ
jgi:serine protease Do